MDLGTKNTDVSWLSRLRSSIIKKMKKKIKFGILVCGSGIGMSMAANKHKNIRAALCNNIKSAKLSRKHNNANVIAIGARLTKKNIALKCVNNF